MNAFCSRKKPYVRVIASAALLSCPFMGQAQFGREGRSIGTATRQGNVIVLELNEGVMGKPNLFNLAHRTLKFTPEGKGGGYHIENLPTQWDADYGQELTNSQAALKNFSFPFSGKTWNAMSVGMTGSVTFGDPAPEAGRRNGGAPGGPGGPRGGGLQVDRFAELGVAASGIINSQNAISVFFKPRMNGKRYLKETADVATITWDLTEPVGGVQDMYWKPTVNKFQARLYKNGVIELAYDAVNAEDAIIGVYPTISEGKEKEIATVQGESNASAPAHLDIKSVKLTAKDGLFLQASIETRGPVLAEGSQGLAGVSYHVCFDKQKPTGDCSARSSSEVQWTVMGGGFRGGGGRPGGPARYNAMGTGVTANSVKATGNTVTLQGTLPAEFKAGDEVYISASAEVVGQQPVTGGKVTAHPVKLAGLVSPAVDFSSLKKQDGPFPVAYESFHYYKPPGAQNLTCSVIKSLGDHFDLLAYYSDFRIDNPEAGTSSTGPLGGGPNGGKVTGIGAEQRGLANFCTQGRFQWQFIQPVYVNANQMQEYPPEGLQEPDTHNVVHYTQQLSERTFNGKIPPYDYAMSQIAHEMGHRWSAFASAKVGDEVIQLGPTHYQRGLQAPDPFPYQRPTEASLMGGGVWQDNFDGTFTQLDDDYYVPATGWSYLDLYLMGFIAPSEVPDFFLLRNMQNVSRDANGHQVVKADRVKITVNDVIAHEGPRMPDVTHSQREFNTGMVLVVEHGKQPSQDLINKVNGIAERWKDYWETTTGHRSTMTTNPN